MLTRGSRLYFAHILIQEVFQQPVAFSEIHPPNILRPQGPLRGSAFSLGAHDPLP
jgi:hypothetical protein